MKNIGYADTKNKQGGGISPLNLGKLTEKALEKFREKRAAKAQGKSKTQGKSIGALMKTPSGSGDSVLAYTPLYSKCKGEDCDEDKKKKEPKEPKSPRIPLENKWKNRGGKPPKMDTKLKWGNQKVEQKRQKIKTS